MRSLARPGSVPRATPCRPDAGARASARAGLVQRLLGRCGRARMGTNGHAGVPPVGSRVFRPPRGSRRGRHRRTERGQPGVVWRGTDAGPVLGRRRGPPRCWSPRSTGEVGRLRARRPARRPVRSPGDRLGQRAPRGSPQRAGAALWQAVLGVRTPDRVKGVTVQAGDSDTETIDIALARGFRRRGLAPGERAGPGHHRGAPGPADRRPCAGNAAAGDARRRGGGRLARLRRGLPPADARHPRTWPKVATRCRTTGCGPS